MPKPNPTKRTARGPLLATPPAIASLVGKTFGRLEVLGYGGRTRNGRKLAVCRCTCGMYIDVPGIALTHGNSTSCGCAHREFVQANNAKRATHGHSRGGVLTAEYRAYQAMMGRCYSKTHDQYERYGGRGITVCRRWRAGFEPFLEDMGPKPTPQHALERADNDKGYSPENCRWATHTEQMRNVSSNVLYALDGEEKTLAEWAEIHGMPYDAVYQRVTKFAWSVEEAVAVPVGGGGRATTNDKPEHERMRFVWHAMLARCYNPRHIRFARYGGRGIAVCDRWRRSLDAFIADVGPRPSPQHTLDRRDGTRGYEPDNVRWATAKEQNRNRSNTKLYEIDGEHRPLAEWGELAGKPYALLRGRMHAGWPIKEALGTPVGVRGLKGRVPWRR